MNFIHSDKTRELLPCDNLKQEERLQESAWDVGLLQDQPSLNYQSFAASDIDSALPLTVEIDEDGLNYIYLNITQQKYPRERS